MYQRHLFVLLCLIVIGCEQPPPSEIVAVDILARTGGEVRRAGPYKFAEGETGVSIEALGLGNDVIVSARKVERREATLIIDVGGAQHKLNVTAKGVDLQLPDRDSSLTFTFRSSTLPPFDSDVAVSDRMTVYRLIENRAGLGVGEFHTYPIRKERTGSSSELANHLKSVLADDRTGVQGADCIMAEYGISGAVDGRNIDLRFSFDCAWLYVYEGDDMYIYGFDGSRAVEFREAIDLFLTGV